MLMKLGPLVTDIAGSIGGLTIQRSRDGAVGRSKPLPVLRQSTKSANARQRMQSVTKAWSAMSAGERADWDIFAATVSWFNRFGDPVTGSGYRAFLKNNAAMHTNGLYSAVEAIRTTPPNSTFGTLPLDVAFVYDTGTSLLQLQSLGPEVDSKTVLYLFASQPFSAGRRFNYLRMPFLVALEPSKPLPANIGTQYSALFGQQPDYGQLQSAFLRVQAADSNSLWPAMSVQLPLVYK